MPLGLETLGRAVMHRAQRGLYAGRQVKFGNKVSEDGGNKSRRMWRPNAQYKALFSHLLDAQVRVRVTTHALRCIDKAGGIDEYLLSTPDSKIDSEVGLRWKRLLEQVIETRKAQGGGQLGLQGLLSGLNLSPDTGTAPSGETSAQSQATESTPMDR